MDEPAFFGMHLLVGHGRSQTFDPRPQACLILDQFVQVFAAADLWIKPTFPKGIPFGVVSHFGPPLHPTI